MFYDGQPPLDPDSPNPFWLFGTMTDRLVTVISMPPSARTWEALDILGRHPLTPSERVLLAEAWDRQTHAATARMHAAVHTATTPTADTDGVDLTTEVG